MPPAEHLARHRMAQLFLDSWPCNAHTTASDALWAGLPVLTCAGESFPARVAASLLNAVGLSELVATGLDRYEELAVDLATDPARLSGLARRLSENRMTAPLFDTVLFTRRIEAAYLEMYSRYRQGLAPDHISIMES
jgi:predicted O-linked N-acetylglucosamine transferase (SPINDLY family)